MYEQLKFSNMKVTITSLNWETIAAYIQSISGANMPTSAVDELKDNLASLQFPMTVDVFLPFVGEPQVKKAIMPLKFPWNKMPLDWFNVRPAE